jgi:phosphatidylserine/phosphatidylglycerophosphate/cardiolipin synthase-like enzyme
MIRSHAIPYQRHFFASNARNYWKILILFAVTAVISRAADVDVYFSPNGGVTDAAVREINNAKREILIQAYSFTSTPIASALAAAEKRGLKVEAILDKSNVRQGYSSITFLENAGIPVYIDDHIKIAHSKIMIIDDSEVITGSFNPGLVAKYLKNYSWRLSLSLRLQEGESK